MNYKKVYDQLIERSKNRVVKGYTEKHHIVPRCMGGEDTEDNLVDLTAREHFIAHWLLARENPSHTGLVKAFQMMAIMHGKDHIRYTPSSRTIAEAREMTRPHSKESIEKMRKAAQNQSEEKKRAISETMKKIWNERNHHHFSNKSQEHLNKLSIAMKNIKKQTCQYCGKDNLTPQNYNRWHGVNCKSYA